MMKEARLSFKKNDTNQDIMVISNGRKGLGKIIFEITYWPTSAESTIAAKNSCFLNAKKFGIKKLWVESIYGKSIDLDESIDLEK